MYAVRRTLAMAGAAGLLLLGGPAYADNHDTSTSSDTPTVDIGPDVPAPEAPVVDCGFIAPDPNQGIAVGEPAPDGTAGGTQLAGDDVKPVANNPGPDPNAPVDPAAEELAAGSGAAPDGQPSPEEFCIAASGPGLLPVPETVSDTSAGGGAGAGSGSLPPTGQLPRTGPAPLLPSIAVGSWLLLLGVAAMIIGRRRPSWA